MKNKTLINVRVKPEMIEDLNKISNHLDVPYSQIVREAINEKVNQLVAGNPELKKILKKSLALQS
ncbi:MAG: BrnA antitoxin family protein [Acidobacteriota bacterium]|nr:BrnA antitoxin family protein [Acidobacteriota bacterium]